MNVLECVAMSWKAVLANRTRSALTMLGVVIGVAAVIALVSLGQGAQDSVTASMASLGTNIILVEARGYARFEAQDVTELLERVPTLSAGSPIMGAMVPAKNGALSAAVEVLGVTDDFLDIMSYDLVAGRFLNEYEVASRQKVCVVAGQVNRDVFDNEAYPGDSIQLRGETYEVVGVLKMKGQVMGQNHDNRVFIPYTTCERAFGKYFNTAIFTAKSSAVATTAGDHIARILDEKFRNTNREIEKKYGMRVEPYRVYCQEEIQQSFGKITGTLTLLLVGIAGVSLLVSGIGIMNIMLVSVTERTREIGIRKSIGAKRPQVLLQFLVEALLLSCTGGLIGIVLGGQIARTLGGLGNLQVTVSPTAALLAFTFATVVGVFFGIYPAFRAANLDPIVALRHE